MDDGNAGPVRKSSRSLAGVKRTYNNPESDTDETLLSQLLGDDSLDDPEYENEVKNDDTESSSEEDCSKEGQSPGKCSKSSQKSRKRSSNDQSPRKSSTCGESSQKRSKSVQSPQKCSKSGASRQPLPPPLCLPSTSTGNRSKQPLKIDHFFKKGAVTKSPAKIARNPFFKPKEPIVVLENDAPGSI